jgi:hypothetical protein
MDKNLQAYIKIYKDRIPTNLREKTLEKLQTVTWKQHTFYDNTENKSAPRIGDEELDVSWATEDKLFDDLMDITWGAIDSYVKDLNFPWMGGWHGFTRLRFNRYNEGKRMDLHCDHIQHMFDGKRKGVPILSIVAALNNDYEGGDFIMFEDLPIRLEAGSYLIFPSNFLYPHKVNPVTKGERNTFVSWVW